MSSGDFHGLHRTEISTNKKFCIKWKLDFRLIYIKDESTYTSMGCDLSYIGMLLAILPTGNQSPSTGSGTVSEIMLADKLEHLPLVCTAEVQYMVQNMTIFLCFNWDSWIQMKEKILTPRWRLFDQERNLRKYL